MIAPLISLLMNAANAPVLPVPPGSIVTQVVVYPDRAQVTRSIEVPCSTHALARFEGLTPAADPTSFRAHSSSGTVEGLRTEEHSRAEAFSKPVQELVEQIRSLDAQDTALRDEQARLANVARISNSYNEVAVGLVDREMVEPVPASAGWTQAFDLALQSKLRATRQIVALEEKRRALAEKRDDAQTALSRMQVSATRQERLAEVLVSCPAGTATRVDLTYLVGGASWEPAYEARAEEAQGAVELTTLATVQQNTGEPWTHAHVVLSTAVPRQQATPPEIQPMKIWGEEHGPERKVLVRRDEEEKHAEVSNGAPAAKTEAKADPGPTTPLRAASQGLSVQLEVPEPSDVAGDGTPIRLFVARNRMNASFAFRAVPKLMPFVFRVADLDNGAPFPLLPGPIDAFGKSGFIARYPMERVAEGAHFHLTFGVADGLKVKRTVVEEVKRETGLFGGNYRFKYAYEIELANYERDAREIELSEHYPVSELDDVKVAIDSKTTTGFTQKAEDGILVWKVKLAPSEKRTLDLRFYVDVPSSYDLGNL
jgi:uncharacterized protein (TIGR02231 family)